MDSERSVVIQKKMILVLAFIIVFVFLFICYRENTSVVDEITDAFVQLPNTITVERNDEEVEYKNVRYLMSNSLRASLIKDEATPASSDIAPEEYVFWDDADNLEIAIVVDRDASPANVEVEEVNNEVSIEQTSTSGKEIGEYKDCIEVTATAYCLCKSCCGKLPSDPYYGYTASGLKIVPGTNMKVIAVDPNVIPLNSHVYVEGMYGAWDYGFAVAADTGGAIKNKKIDLYMDSHEEALRWGRKTVKVYVLD